MKRFVVRYYKVVRLEEEIEAENAFEALKIGQRKSSQGQSELTEVWEIPTQ